jgi:Mrp family chromosome partitioning ATPase
MAARADDGGHQHDDFARVFTVPDNDTLRQKVLTMTHNQTRTDTIDTPTVPRIVATPPPALAPLPHTSLSLSKREKAAARLFQERCRQLTIDIFYQGNAPIRSLGFTSAIHGEGKSFLAALTAQLLAADSSTPVTLLECNWEHPTVHDYFGLSAHPGAAEWLRHECRIEDIRSQIEPNFTVIPAGNGKKDAVKLLEQVRQQGLYQSFAPNNDLLIVDLPSTVTTAYGSIAAGLLDAVIVVIHAGVTPDTLVAEACAKLKNAPVQGVILNQLQSKTPRWLRQLL